MQVIELGIVEQPHDMAFCFVKSPGILHNVERERHTVLTVGCVARWLPTSRKKVQVGADRKFLRILSTALHYFATYSTLIRISLIQSGSYFVNRFTAVRFTATGAPSAAGRIRILLMNQYVCWPINVRNEVLKCCHSTCRHSFHGRETL
jgi:hypothetical protein